MTNKDECGNCVFFEKRPLQDSGECHRFPPQVNLAVNQLGNSMSIGAFPPTKAINWCGEHKKEIDVGSGLSN